MIKRQAQLILKEETEYAETIFQLDFTSINVGGFERTASIIPTVDVASIGLVEGQKESGAATQLTTHRAFQAAQGKAATVATDDRHQPEINPAPLIIGGLMLATITFHVYGAVQYYRGSIDSNKVECKK